MWMKKHGPCCFKKGPTRAFFTTRAWNTYEMSGKLLDRYLFLYYSWFVLSALWGLICEVYTVSFMYLRQLLLGSPSFRLGPRGVALVLIFWIRFSKNPPRLPKRDWDLFRSFYPRWLRSQLSVTDTPMWQNEHWLHWPRTHKVPARFLEDLRDQPTFDLLKF